MSSPGHHGQFAVWNHLVHFKGLPDWEEPVAVSQQVQRWRDDPPQFCLALGQRGKPHSRDLLDQSRPVIWTVDITMDLLPQGQHIEIDLPHLSKIGLACFFGTDHLQDFEVSI